MPPKVAPRDKLPKRSGMINARTGEVAVIFVSERTGADDVGYAEAASAMERLAALQPGYRGIDNARGGDGIGITVSYWADDASAAAWRDDPEHARIRELGRARWYNWYRLYVTRVTRGYGWERA